MSREPITDQELAAIRNAIGRIHFANYVYVQCTLGLRPAEFLALKMSDVTLEGDKTFLTVRGSREGVPDRVIEIPEETGIRDILEGRLRQYGTDMLFPVPTVRHGVYCGWQQPSCRTYNERIFKPLMKELGIEGKTAICGAGRKKDNGSPERLI